MKKNVFESLGQLQKYGHIKFKQSISHNALESIRKIQIWRNSMVKINMKINKKSLSQNGQSLPTDQQMDENLIRVLSYIETVNFQEVQFFKVFGENLPKIIINFAGIQFHQLEYLNLTSCNLRSIEFLTFLDLPNLQRIILDNNDLTNLKSFAKSTFPKLFWIDLVSNQCKDAKAFHRSHLAPRLAVLQITEKRNNFGRMNQSAVYYHNVFYYLNFWFFKLPFHSINYIRKRRPTIFLSKKSLEKSRPKISQRQIQMMNFSMLHFISQKDSSIKYGI